LQYLQHLKMPKYNIPTLKDLDVLVMKFVLHKKSEKVMRKSKNTGYTAVIQDIIKSHPEYLKFIAK